MIERIRELIRSVTDWLRRVVTQPRSEMTRLQRTARFGYDLGRHGARRLGRDQAPQMAAALAYRTLFGLLPVLVVATVVARAIMGHDEFMGMADRLIESLNLQQVDFAGVEGATIHPGGTQTDAADASDLGAWLRDMLKRAMGINLAAIGWVGLGVLIYAAIGLVVTVERTFNRICDAPEGRSWGMRVLLYWFVLTVAPLAVGLTFWVDAQVDSIIEAVGGWQWVLITANAVWSLTIVWLLMVAVYMLVPNTSVSCKASMIGALVAAIALSAGTRLFGVYLDNAVSFAQLYGSLGLIPLFMFWVYMMWLMILFGLEVTSCLDELGDRQFEELEDRTTRTGLVDPARVISVMEVAVARFREGMTFTPSQIAADLMMNESLVRVIIERLRAEGLLHALASPEGAFTLSKPPEDIMADDLLRIGFQMVDERAETYATGGMLGTLRQAQLASASGLSLAGTDGGAPGD